MSMMCVEGDVVDVCITIYMPAATAAWAERSIPVTLLLASSLSRGLNWSVEFSY